MKKTAFIVVLALCLLVRMGVASAQASKCDVDQFDYQTTSSSGFEDSAFIWLGPGHMCQMMVANQAGSTVWAMWFDAKSLPANGTHPKQQFPIASGGSNGIFSYPSKFYTGVVLACSTTAGILTVTAANDCSFTAKIAP